MRLSGNLVAVLLGRRPAGLDAVKPGACRMACQNGRVGIRLLRRLLIAAAAD